MRETSSGEASTVGENLPGIKDGLEGMRFVQSAVDSSENDAEWLTFEV